MFLVIKADTLRLITDKNKFLISQVKLNHGCKSTNYRRCLFFCRNIKKLNTGWKQNFHIKCMIRDKQICRKDSSVWHQTKMYNNVQVPLICCTSIVFHISFLYIFGYSSYFVYTPFEHIDFQEYFNLNIYSLTGRECKTLTSKHFHTRCQFWCLIFVLNKIFYSGNF